jgi:hypothetical protein
MLWLLAYIDDSSKLHGLEQLWYKDWKPRTEAVNSGFEDHERYIVMKLINKESFSFAISLNQMFHFSQDYD